MIFKKKYVGIMVKNPRERKSVLRRYLPFISPNINLFCFTPSSINWEKRTIIGLNRSSSSWRQKQFPFPIVIYNRYYGLSHSILQRLIETIGENKCFNHITQFDKLVIYDVLNKSELNYYLPDTVSYDKDQSNDWLETHQVLYFKPCFGFNGKGIYRVEKTWNGEIHISHNHFAPVNIIRDASLFKEVIHKHIGTIPYIIQKGVDIQQMNGRNFDVRVLVQKNKKGEWSVTNIVSRIAFKQYYNTSVCEKVCFSKKALRHLYPIDTVNSLIKSFINISLKAAYIIEKNTKWHLGELSVDFVVDIERQIWIIEINGQPQKDLYKEIPHHKVIYKRPLQYAEYLLN